MVREYIKPLEWNPFDAETPFGYAYRIYEEHGFDRKCWSINLVDGRFDSIKEARAAAQADYAARIASALSPAFIERIAALEAENARMREARDNIEIEHALVSGDDGYNYAAGQEYGLRRALMIFDRARTTLQEHAEDGDKGDEG
jgi:hypothetical protein